MTVSELLVELRRLQRQGKGDAQVFVMRYGDQFCMPSAKVRSYDTHVVVVAPNPRLLWPTGTEQVAVCSTEDALYDSEKDRDNAYYCRNSGGSM